MKTSADIQHLDFPTPVVEEWVTYFRLPHPTDSRKTLLVQKRDGMTRTITV